MKSMFSSFDETQLDSDTVSNQWAHWAVLYFSKIFVMLLFFSFVILSQAKGELNQNEELQHSIPNFRSIKKLTFRFWVSYWLHFGVPDFSTSKKFFLKNVKWGLDFQVCALLVVLKWTENFASFYRLNIETPIIFH